MRMRSFASLAVPSLFVLSISPVARGADPLTLEDALSIARERAPSIVAERMRLDESRARAAERRRAFATNPELGAMIGRREAAGSGDGTNDWEIAIAQNFGDLVRASARADAADATLEAESRAAEEAGRSLLLEVASSYVALVADERRLTLTRESAEMAARLLEAATRRFDAGDVAQLDVNVARTILARAAAEESSAAASLATSRARLASMLGIGDAGSIAVAGELTLPAPAPEPDFAASVATRADFRRLDAEIATTRAEVSLAAPLRVLDWGLVAAVAEDEGDRITSAGVRVALPFADRGRNVRAEAAARLARLEHERAALLLAATAELSAAASAYAQLRESASAMTGSLLPLLAESDLLALESYDGGQIGIAELAAVRRESNDARNAAVEHWREARLAGLRLSFLSGDLR